MKKILIVALILVLAIGGLLLFGMNNQTERLTPEEAVELCFEVMGEKDETTGFPFSFGVTATVEQDEKEYYVIRGSWLVDNSHLSYIGDFFVTVDGKEVYTGTALDGEYEIENIIWSSN